MMCNITEISRGLLLAPALLLLFSPLVAFAEPPDLTMAKIRERQSMIRNAARKFDVNPQYLSAIIHTERTLNYDWTDDTMDVAIAKAGRNSSLGFCQIKLKTAYFIEVQLHNAASRFYPGKRYQNILQVSLSPEDLIDKLMDDSSNVLYAAAYLRIMQTRWAKAGFPIDHRPDILGTLYSTGLFHAGGIERQPNPRPKPNDFGRRVAEAARLFKEK